MSILDYLKGPSGLFLPYHTVAPWKFSSFGCCCEGLTGYCLYCPNGAPKIVYVTISGAHGSEFGFDCGTLCDTSWNKTHTVPMDAAPPNNCVGSLQLGVTCGNATGSIDISLFTGPKITVNIVETNTIFIGSTTWAFEATTSDCNWNNQSLSFRDRTNLGAGGGNCFFWGPPTSVSVSV